MLLLNKTFQIYLYNLAAMKISDNRRFRYYGETVIVIINGKPEIVKDFGRNYTCGVKGVFYNFIPYTQDKFIRVKRFIKYLSTK